MTHIQQCMVLNCDCPADQVWCTPSGYQRWAVEWYVCDDHYDQLITGDKNSPVYGPTPKAPRWLVMGDDLNTQAFATGQGMTSQQPQPGAASPSAIRHRRLSLRRH